MKSLSRVMDHVHAYRLWQSPFAEQKLAPARRDGGFSAARRVLDVGCGPGTNARHFARADYIGLDVNPEYIAYARRRYGDRFEVADVCRWDPPAGAKGFDYILVNSFLHHVDTPDVRRILSRLASLLTDAGRVHILDLVMPERPGPSRLLARWDRGNHPRLLPEWRALFAEAFEPVLFEPYPVGVAGMTLWEMVYFQGKRRA